MDIKKTISELTRIHGNLLNGNQASAMMFNAVLIEKWPDIAKELDMAYENLVAMDAQRAEAVRERDEAQAKFLEAGKLLHETQLAKREISDERDALRAQVAELNEMGDATSKRLSEMLTNRTHQLNEARAQVEELRAAVLSLWKHAPTVERVRSDYNEVDYVEVRVNEAVFFAIDAIVANLRAESRQQGGEAGR